ncbi:hypothetical protein HRED_00513 [Candidatus Haloredivivus sp. G17]|nr:hypothetical protein HRED_00513 [Candidatus Haloredivivus sp. G17]
MSIKMNGLINRMRKVKHPEWFEEEDEENNGISGEGVNIPSPGPFQTGDG